MEVPGATLKMKRIATLAVLSVLLLPPAPAARMTHRLQLARGQRSAVAKGYLERGDRADYLIRGRPGQRVSVLVSSVRENAILSLYMPGRQKPVRGTEERAARTRW